VEIVNLTPSAINVADDEGNIIVTFPPSGNIAYVITGSNMTRELAGRPIIRVIFGEVTGIPEPSDDVIYLVTTTVAQAAKRPDVISPNTDHTAVRKGGQIVAVREFHVFA
jgi:hypothetical protein